MTYYLFFSVITASFMTATTCSEYKLTKIASIMCDRLLFILSILLRKRINED